MTTNNTHERARLAEDTTMVSPWRLWGPYLSERQWGTVREDYSADGDCWVSFPHDQARSRAYRWGEDGLLGITDRECRLCFGLALWNGNDPILKERLFGLSNPRGNHGEDVKELYYYQDATPTASYLKGLYKYPQARFPYEHLIQENAARGFHDPEYELLDTGLFDERRYFDVQVEYAKESPCDVLIRVTVTNQGPEKATLHLLPTLWCRNTWVWGGGYEADWERPTLSKIAEGIQADHADLSRYLWQAEGEPEWVFTDNETNTERLFGATDSPKYSKDAFHRYVIGGEKGAINPKQTGTKAAAIYKLELEPGEQHVVRLRLRAPNPEMGDAFDERFDLTFAKRREEADQFYGKLAEGLDTDQAQIMREAYSGLIWNQQFYYYHIPDWVEGDPAQPAPPAHRAHPNQDWDHLHARDILSMPDKWEFPWFAVWDTAFHMIPYSRLDSDFAKHQLLRFLREWYMHPSGQLPAYEFNFSDVNPPVHAWACWQVYQRSGRSDHTFLARVFQKLTLNFTWWVNRKDKTGRHLFSGGFLGLDNIGVFDRSKKLPVDGHLEQADGTAWMAFFCAELLAMGLELAAHDAAYEDMASKFFEHYLAITTAINTLDGTGLWDEEDGFYYDHLHLTGNMIPLKVRSMVGLIPLFAVELLSREALDRLPDFSRRVQWVSRHRPEQTAHLELPGTEGPIDPDHYLLTIPSRERLERLLRYVFDENEFLSPYGVRSLSKIHEEHPFVFGEGAEAHTVAYIPAEADSGMFGGNSNWRGPVWFPVNFLLIESLRRYGQYYGDDLKVELPTGSGNWVNLTEAADDLSARLVKIFVPDEKGRRACHGDDPRYAENPDWHNLILYYEYFHGDNGRGCGASHQTGWTALVASLLFDSRQRG